MHIGTHFESFYLPDYISRQKQFFGHFLKGEDNGWLKTPLIRLEIRLADGVEVRGETEWPLARTNWTKYFLDAATMGLAPSVAQKAATAVYRPLGDGVSFSTDPFTERTEFTGPLMARLWLSSSTTDLDLFVTLRMFAPDAKEVVFDGASDLTPVARGWLRASHRKLDTKRSLPYRPFHAHDEVQKLEPGRAYPLDVEIWPTSIVFPKGHRMVLTLQGRDFEALNAPGRLLHDHEHDRPRAEFDGLNTVLTGPDHVSYLLLPQIPGG